MDQILRNFLFYICKIKLVSVGFIKRELEFGLVILKEI